MKKPSICIPHPAEFWFVVIFLGCGACAFLILALICALRGDLLTVILCFVAVALFIAGVAEGVLPLSRPGAEADVEEERRLFFVGMTRAKEELILTCPGAPSCFIGELGEGLAPETARSRVRPPKVEQLTLF